MCLLSKCWSAIIPARGSGFCARRRLRFTWDTNRITSVEVRTRTLEQAFKEHTHTDENSDRVGEFAIGERTSVYRCSGDWEHPAGREVAGIHIAIGDPYGAHTGAPWKSTTQIDVV